jgi:hypothetical protein
LISVGSFKAEIKTREIEFFYSLTYYKSEKISDRQVLEVHITQHLPSSNDKTSILPRKMSALRIKFYQFSLDFDRKEKGKDKIFRFTSSHWFR